MDNLIIVRNNENLKGIFYYSDVNYSIIATTKSGNLSQLSHYNEANTFWYSSSDSPQVLIKFAHPVLLTNYSIIKNPGNSYPASFVLYGKRNGRFIELDRREDQKFDGDDVQAAKNLTVTYQTSVSLLTKEILLKQIKSSASDVTYLLLRGLEFYGIVCKNYKIINRFTCKNNAKNSLSKLVFVIVATFCS